MKFELDNDYQSILEYSKEAIQALQKNEKTTPPQRIASFVLRKLVSHLHLRSYTDAENGIQEYLAIVKEGTRNWFIGLNYKLQLAFFRGDFSFAYQIYIQAFSHPGFKRQHAKITEEWKLHEAFIFYFIYTGKIQPNENNPTKKFRITKFLNDMPLYSKDKRGHNINILILQILFLLHQKQYGKIIDRMDSLKMYEYRYLKKDSSFRSSCFIKLLMKLAEADFHKAAVLRKTEKLRKRLDEKPIELANQSAELEIVPYEQLWEFVLEELDNKFH